MYTPQIVLLQCTWPNRTPATMRARLLARISVILLVRSRFLSYTAVFSSDVYSCGCVRSLSDRARYSKCACIKVSSPTGWDPRSRYALAWLNAFICLCPSVRHTLPIAVFMSTLEVAYVAFQSVPDQANAPAWRCRRQRAWTLGRYARITFYMQICQLVWSLVVRVPMPLWEDPWVTMIEATALEKRNYAHN